MNFPGRRFRQAATPPDFAGNAIRPCRLETARIDWHEGNIQPHIQHDAAI